MMDNPAGPSDHRRGWIALAAAGPVASCGDALTTAADAPGFLVLLDESRPRIAIVTEPPATAELVERVALERRRRTTLRIVHLAADDAVDQRLHALRIGFDDALPIGIPTDEFLGRLALLDEQARTVTGSTTLIQLGDGLVLDLAAPRAAAGGPPGPPATEGIRPARPPRGASWPRLYEASAPRPGLGSRARRGPADRGRPRALAALEDRAGAGPAGPPRDAAWRRVSPRPAGPPLIDG